MKKNALQLLMEDHEYVKKSHRAFEKLDHEEHLEEEIFYPALRKALKDQDLLEEAEIEHDSAKTHTVLCEYVEHHIARCASSRRMRARSRTSSRPGSCRTARA